MSSHPDDPDYFHWAGADIDIAHQAPIAVYTNADGDVVIRQDGDYYRKDDACIVVRPENARRLVDAILELAAPMEPAPLALSAPADRTAAERQRRCRERKRHDQRVTATVTQRDSNSGKDLFAPV